MYKIRGWAHDTAREHNFNPWSADEKKHVDSDAPVVQDEERNQDTSNTPKEKEKKSLLAQIVHNLRIIFLRSWLNLLLIFVPGGIAVQAAGIDKTVVFALNAVAVVPLAGLLTFATECLASRTSPTIAALLNVSFGNSVELIIFIVALIQRQIRIVQASLVGSILANLLLILGMSMTLGGLKYQEQIYDSLVTQMSSSCLVLASLSLLFPTVFHASFSDQDAADASVLKISRGASVILLVVYILYLLFQLKSHAYMYEGTPQHIIDEQTEPGILQRMNSSSSSSSSETSRSSSVSTTGSGRSSGWRRRVKRKAKAKLGRRRSTKIEDNVITEEEEDAPVSSDAPVTVSPKSPRRARTLDSPAPANESSTQPIVGHLTEEPIVEEPSTSPSAALPHPATTPATVSDKRPSPLYRGISSIRVPPVFRKDSGNLPQQRPQHLQIRSTAGQMRRYNSSPNMVTNSFTRQQSSTSIHTRPARHQPTGLSEQTGMPIAPIETCEADPPIGLKTSIILLLCSTALVAVCAEFMVSSIEYLVETSPLSEAFVGLIILPIVGNAAEHVTAVVVASKNKLDLALAVALGSSIQIALFITPLVVIIGWIADVDMSLYFTLFETVALFGSVFIVCFLCLDGRSNYLEGALLCAVYIILAVGAYFFPDSESQNTFVGGTGDPSKRMVLRQ